jgi:hypothetical protein
VETDPLIKKTRALLKDSKRLERELKENFNATAKIVEACRKGRAELRDSGGGKHKVKGKG